MQPTARFRNKAITTTFLICMILASSYTMLAAAEQPNWEAQPMHRIKSSGIDPSATGPYNPYFTPADIKTAYNLPALGGSGTIAIIDAYDNPRAVTDLAFFSSQFDLPAANLEIHKMSSSIRANAGWAMEIALDVQWAHAIAPNAKILLVEATTNSITNLLSAVSYARNRGDVVAISMSWGANEFSGQTAYDSYFTSSYGASFFASSGDAGGVVSWPSSSTNVISVGGTTLTQTALGYTETAWSGSGGGVSVYESKPTYQASLSYSKRATPDVAYNADPNTGFLVYDSYGYGGAKGWFAVGGTSAGAPQWAAIQAIGKSATNANFYASYPQSYGVDFTDITIGQSGSYTASSEYDLSTGIGSPIGTDFGAPPTPDFAISALPSSLTIKAGAADTSTVAVTSLGGFTGQVDLTATTPDQQWNPTLSLSQPYVQSSGQSQLTISVPANTPAGIYTVTVQGKSGSIVHTTTLTVQVTKGDFSLTASPTSLSIRRGRSGTSRITVNSINGYTDSPTLSSTGAPTGMTMSFSKNPVPASSYATMTVNVASSTSQGTYTITITGTDSSGTARTTTVRVTVRR
jgi:subtilase family serine protease